MARGGARKTSGGTVTAQRCLRWAATPFALLLVACTAAGWAGEPLPADHRVAQLCGIEWPPFSKAAGSELDSGISVDIVRMAFARLGRPVQIHALSWVLCRRAVAEGKLDGTVDATPAVDEYAGAHFTTIYPLAVFVAADSPVQTLDPEQLRGEQVGMVRGYGYGHTITDHAHWQRIDASNDEQLMLWLKLKRVKYVVTDIFAGPVLAAKVGVRIRPLAPLLDVSPLYVAFGKGNAALAADFDRVLGDMIADGSVDTIYRRYLPYNFREARRRWLPE